MSAIEPVRPRDPRVPVSPQLAWRVAILGMIAMIFFGVIFFRLWYLQILTGEQYVHQADVNHTRDLPIAAPRGEIFDREGKPIVSSRTTNAVQIIPGLLPPGITEQAVAYQKALYAAENARKAALVRLADYDRSLAGISHLTRAEHAEHRALTAEAAEPKVPVPPIARADHRLRSLFARLGRVIGLRARTIDERVVQGMTATPYAHVTVKTDAGRGALTVLGERAAEYPGVAQEPVSIRAYPFGEMAAQVIGHVDQISEPELKLKAFRGVRAGTVVGQEGLEYYYDAYLRGRPGIQRIEVNAAGEPVATRLAPTLPQAGHSLKVSLDLGLQREAEKAMAQGKAQAQAGAKPANGGAFVAMDPRNGQILAIGSSPGFDPNRFAKPLTPTEYRELVGSGSAAGPLDDKAENGAYPTGSTFKPITAMAALEGGVISPGEGLGSGSCISVSTQQFCNAGHTDYGPVGLVQALKVSSDTYFFEVGERAFTHGTVIQREAEKLGIGRFTGIDLPSEFKGVVPGPSWRREQNKLELQCERRRHVSNCGIVLEPERVWSVGDNMHLAVGQGELLTDPLQMAVAYSTLANAYTHGGVGTVVTPHLGLEIDEGDGSLRQTLSFPSHTVHLDDEDVNLVMEGIHKAASESGGTSADVWTGWNQAQDPVFGKTGTAQHYNQEDQSWYMCYIGDAKRPIVIAVTVEQGGFGAETAAPIARLIASQWYHQPLKFVAGSSKTL
ncbi:MAG TPA: penicillin-binding transpeptidase domain-containing protein [Solirubrobacteraceae bacterium]|jgi:penicillin-binding protein 2|nr:penicillin-binding transpeptidase domain-containing protein [Solirubrobacteraceae bacterium]